jgi:hypothetical protein
MLPLDSEDPTKSYYRTLILWHDSSDRACTRWQLTLVPVSAAELEASSELTDEVPTEMVGVVNVFPDPPILYICTFDIFDRHQGTGYGRAFAKRLNTLLTRRAYGFDDCANVALHGVGDAFPFWKKVVGIRHFMKSADAYFGVKDLAGGGLPSEEQLRGFWGDECWHDESVVEELVWEWGERVKRRLRVREQQCRDAQAGP